MLLVPLLIAVVGAAEVPTFGTAVDMVGITVTAVDERTGAPVGDLEQRDFIVTQDNAARPIVHFEKHDIPASVVVMIDVSRSVRDLLPHIERAASRLIRSLRPHDEVQVAELATQYQELTEFTTDHEHAVDAIGSAFVRDDATMLNRGLLTAITALERRFPEDTERRRIIVLLSDGENTPDAFSPRQVLDRIRRSGVLCYVVHVARRFAGEDQQVLDARKFMENIAYESGGRLVTVPYYRPRLLDDAYLSIAEELEVQYHLAYVSPSDRPGWHDIGVALRNRTGVTLRYRRAYYVPFRR